MTNPNDNKKDTPGEIQPAYKTTFRQRVPYTQEDLDRLNEMIRQIQLKKVEDQKHKPK